jgi:pyruvate/2-oxoglutarate dehydrogenase complex dihydrolipoamide acyltransferase (E2) component
MRLVAVILPDLGTGADSPVTVSYWYAARGETVWEGDRLVEVLVGPATFDVSSPATGRLAEIRLREDDQALPGALLGQIAVLDEDAHGDADEGRERDQGGSDRGRDQGHGPRPSGQRPQ